LLKPRKDLGTLQEQLFNKGLTTTPQYDFGPSKPVNNDRMKVQIHFPPSERVPDSAAGVIGSRLKTAGIRQLVTGMIRARHLPTTTERWVEIPCEGENNAKAILEVLRDQNWPFKVIGYKLWRS